MFQDGGGDHTDKAEDPIFLYVLVDPRTTPKEYMRQKTTFFEIAIRQIILQRRPHYITFEDGDLIVYRKGSDEMFTRNAAECKKISAQRLGAFRDLGVGEHLFARLNDLGVPVEAIAIVGSVAYGAAEEGSDTNVLVICSRVDRRTESLIRIVNEEAGHNQLFSALGINLIPKALADVHTDTYGFSSYRLRI